MIVQDGNCPRGALTVVTPKTPSIHKRATRVTAGKPVVSTSENSELVGRDSASARSLQLQNWRMRAPVAPSIPEAQVLRMVAAGGSDADIAKALGKSFAVVRYHIGSLTAKLACTSRTQLVQRAEAAGYIRMPRPTTSPESLLAALTASMQAFDAGKIDARAFNKAVKATTTGMLDCARRSLNARRIATTGTTAILHSAPR